MSADRVIALHSTATYGVGGQTNYKLGGNLVEGNLFLAVVHEILSD